MLSCTTQKVNCENEQRFDETIIESDDISQTITGMEATISTLRKLGRTRDMVSAEILEGTNEKAADILRTCKCNAIIPGTTYVPINNFAEFYGVSEDYIKSVLGKFGITHRKTPNDVVRNSGGRFLSEHGLTDKFCCHYRNVWQYRNDNTTMAYQFVCSKASNFYSARVVLAFATLMYQARTVNGECNGRTIYNVLMRSSYADAAKIKMAEAKEREEEAVMASDNQDQNKNQATINQEGQLVLTPEFFAVLIKTAVREAVSECMKEFVPKSQCVMADSAVPETAPAEPPSNTSRRGGSRKKCVKPQNWEQIVSDQKDGKITRAAAARMCNMSLASYGNYVRGIRHF